MTLDHLLAAPPKLHGPDGALTDGYRLDDAGLRFLNSHLTSEMRTIETGAGVSTIVFGLMRARHTCIVPDRRVITRIRRYCASVGVSLETVTFLPRRSEYALPCLTGSSYDFALIDGRHGFPAPFIDWFYIADRLRHHGVVLVDDTWIWTCDVLVRFLDASPGWRRCGTLPCAAAFRKEAIDVQHAEWVDQPFVYDQSPAARFYPPSHARSRSSGSPSLRRRTRIHRSQ